MKLTRPLSTEQTDSIRKADVILAHETGQERPMLFYGETALKRIAGSGKAENLCVVAFEIEPKSDDLEFLAAAVLSIKGECHYRSGMQS